ncbi:uncharacterized protein VTP21DRAFT_5417 [Calcarisporiella thermophila]|uniref:uncharacterized protein n=1 Tax=Calcarisporiella thermophila TaxID=911321 RepID=UPI003743E433
MTSLPILLKQRFLDNVRSLKTSRGYRVVVADARALRFLSAVCNMYDILEENVTLVENLERPRNPYPDLEALYLLTPSVESITRFVNDFSPPSQSKYAAAHLLFTSSLNEQHYGVLNQLLKKAAADRYVLSLKEIHTDFLAVEERVFSLDMPLSFFVMYSPVEEWRVEEEVQRMAKKLASVCVALDECPVVKYYRPRTRRAIAHQLADQVQIEIDNQFRADRRSAPDRPTLIVVDRSIDAVAPLLHEFTYQAMANDLLNLEDGKRFTYTYTAADGQSTQSELVLSETDEIYTQFRHMHIADCTQELANRFSQFLGGSRAHQLQGQNQAANLKDMKQILTELPQYQESKAKFSAHISLAQECMGQFNRKRLAEVGAIEQNIATGETPEGDAPKTLMLDILSVLDSAFIDPEDKLRLLMIYFSARGDSIDADDRAKLMQHARIAAHRQNAIQNLSLLGPPLSRVERDGLWDTWGWNRLAGKLKRAGGGLEGKEEAAYELSRYVPVLKKVVESHIRGTLDADLFPPVREEPKAAEAPAKPAVTSLRTTRPAWHKKGSHPSSPGGPESSSGGGGPGSSGSSAGAPATGPRVMVFVIGGVTYSEMRSVYEAARQHGRDVLLGATHVWTPRQFMEDLSWLHRGIPPPPQPAQPPPPPIAEPRPPSQQKQGKKKEKKSWQAPQPPPMEPQDVTRSTRPPRLSVSSVQLSKLAGAEGLGPRGRGAGERPLSAPPSPHLGEFGEGGGEKKGKVSKLLNKWLK